MDIAAIWNLVVLSPMINVLVMLSKYLFGSFGLAIMALTIIIRLITLPLTLKQLKATKAMQTIQPKLLEIQKKYGRDRQKLNQEMMGLYREAGISPAGCMIPMLVQMPVWIALFQSIVKVLAVVPEDFLSLAQHLYTSWTDVFSLVPLGNQFLWLNLAKPDNLIILPILVGGTMWVQQKMVTQPSIDPRQDSQNRMMLWMMPLMFAFFTLQFPSGLALYWVISNVISIVIQYKVTGWGGLAPMVGTTKATPKFSLKRPDTIEAKLSDQATSTPKTTELQPGSYKTSSWSILRRLRLQSGKDRQQHKQK
ncbi:MAG: YidC/Oxa1 family membrane protein insertase [Dehalococcoidales bacterium]|nr:YidC/Oxa1 family membrane protein insertase [Dehalococcoidales bacterium]